MKRENSIRMSTIVAKKNAQSFVAKSAAKIKTKKEDMSSPIHGNRKKSMSNHLLYGMFSPDKKQKSPVAKRKKRAATVG